MHLVVQNMVCSLACKNILLTCALLGIFASQLGQQDLLPVFLRLDLVGDLGRAVDASQMLLSVWTLELFPCLFLRLQMPVCFATFRATVVSVISG